MTQVMCVPQVGQLIYCAQAITSGISRDANDTKRMKQCRFTNYRSALLGEEPRETDIRGHRRQSILPRSEFQLARYGHRGTEWVVGTRARHKYRARPSSSLADSELTKHRPSQLPASTLDRASITRTLLHHELLHIR